MKKMNVFILALSMILLGGAPPAAADRQPPAPEDGGFVLRMERNAFAYYLWQPADNGGLWVKIALNGLGRSLLTTERGRAGFPTGEYRSAACILCRVELPPGGGEGLPAVREQLYLDRDGRIIARQPAGDGGPDEPPAGYIARECGEFVYWYLRQADRAADGYAGGFCGLPWGAPPEGVPGARRIGAVVVSGMVVYEAAVDSVRLLGDAPASAPARLVFSARDGLVGGTLAFAENDFAAVAAGLKARFGAPYHANGGVLRWFAGRDTVIEITPVTKEGERRLTALEYGWWLRSQQI
jgi:hypothetical protein